MVVDNLRGARGVVRLCLSASPTHFPKCGAGSRGADIAIRPGEVRHVFTGVRPGVYAIAAFHDANRDGKMDTLMGIPREGFAFSRNPDLRPRPPRFGEASFASGGGAVQHLRMRYLL